MLRRTLRKFTTASLKTRRRDARNSFSAEEKSLQSQWLAGAGADTKDRKVMPQHASTTVVQ